MPASVSDDPSGPHSSAAPTISSHGQLITGSGFLPDYNVAIRVTRAGEDISDYLTFMTDGDGYLHGELPASVTGTLYIAVTDRPLRSWGAWGPAVEQPCTLVVAET
jgi:hypothetical protein